MSKNDPLDDSPALADPDLDEAADESATPPPPPPSDLLAAAGDQDERYFNLLAGPLRGCAQYKPKFGKGRATGLTVEEFQRLYRADPFYNWMGLDSPLIYAAHKAAGGMTSIYRQIGIGCQWIFSQLLQDCLGLSAEDAAWTYTVPSDGGKPRALYLDGRIDISNVSDTASRDRLKQWMHACSERLLLSYLLTCPAQRPRSGGVDSRVVGPAGCGHVGCRAAPPEP